MANSMKVYELAKHLGVKSVFLMDKIRKEWKLPVKSHMESLSSDLVEKIEAKFSADVTKVVATKSTATKRKVVKKSATEKVKKSAVKTVQVVKKATSAKSVSASATPSSPVKKALPTIIRRRKEDQKPPQTIQKIKSLEAAPSPQQETDTNLKRGDASGAIRPDLVAVQSANPLQDGSWRENQDKEGFKKPVKKPTTEKEVNVKFQATDFRKREMVFQPKKKRNLISGDVKKTQITTPKESKRVIKIHGEAKIDELAKSMNVKRRDLIKKLKTAGVNTEGLDVLDFDTITLIIPEFGFEAKNVQQTEQGILKILNEESNKDKDEFPFTSKPPVVTIMGHVDHGKTTLLDAIRNTKVAEGEAGGITQHIGAYSVVKNDKSITFIDTPGHEAFTMMRARGVEATDIVVIVVAATDGIMPQTIESINHAQTAKVPMIVAINKMDAPGAQVDKIKQQMAKHEIVPEDWGGDVIFVPISALKGDGIDDLLEQIQILAELQELKYQPNKSARGLVLESHLEKGRGPVVSLLVQDGTLKSGATIVAGESAGRIRQMKNDQGKVIKEIEAGFPVEVVGFDKLPGAGDSFDVVQSEKAVKELIELRKSHKQSMKPDRPMLSVEELLLKTHSQDEAQQELNVIVKSDVAGSLEALKVSLDKLSAETVAVKIIHSGVGGITKNDVMLASTVNGIILGFNVRPNASATQISRDEYVTIKTYSIIYELLDDVKQMMLGKLKSKTIEEEKGTAEVRQIFNISKTGTIAGSYVTSGIIPRNAFVRLVRDGVLIFEGKISGLKHFKEDVKEVKNGFECGISLEKFNDIKPKDIFEAYIKKEIQRTEL